MLPTLFAAIPAVVLWAIPSLLVFRARHLLRDVGQSLDGGMGPRLYNTQNVGIYVSVKVF